MKQYSYDPVPTIYNFNSDDSFVRGLMGPFGSGKSSGCVVEVTRRAQWQRRSPDGIRHSRWAVVRNCYSDDTEILTKDRGWRLFRDLEPEDQVATLRDGALTYERPSYYYAAHYRGPMVCVETDSLNFLVTPDHKLWLSARETRARKWSPFRFEAAKDAFGKTLRRFKRDAEWDGPLSGYSPAFFRFLGFWFADGTAGAYRYDDRPSPHYRLLVVQKEGLDDVRRLLADAGLQWGETRDADSGCTYFRMRVTEPLKALVAELAALGKAPLKHLPLWIKQAPREHLQAFLDGYILGDGSFKNGDPRRVTCAWTSSKRLADDIQEVALKAGEVVNVTARHRPAHGFGQAPGTEYCMTFLQASRRSPLGRDGWGTRPYDGMVYCVEVSTHVVYVRRGGKAFWCGQTFPELRDTTIRTFFQWYPPHAYGHYVEGKHSYRIKGVRAKDGGPCDIEVLFLALDRPEDVSKLLSLEVTGAWINEGREVPWAIFDVLMGRVGRYPAAVDGGCEWWGLWSDTNGPDSDSKWYKFFEDRLGTDGKPLPAKYCAIYKQPSGLSANAENLDNLPGGRGYYLNLKIGKSEEWVKVYIDGDYGFVQDGKAVYPGYVDKVHCKDIDPEPGLTIIRSWDYGLTPACVFSQILPDGRWLTFNEMLSDRMGIDEFSDEVLEHCVRTFRGPVQFEDWGDPAGEQSAQTDARSCFEIQQGKGIDVRASIQTLTMRIESVRKVLRETVAEFEPRFILHSRCKALRKGFMGGYHHRRLQTPGVERYTDVPVKNMYSHPHDALQYGAVRYFAPELTSRGGEDEWPETVDYAALATRSEVTGY